ncbi:MAG: hypothetical protein ABIP36_02055 [Acidimicrobiales bacterium]
MSEAAARRAGLLIGGSVVFVALLGLGLSRNLGWTESPGELVLPYRDDYFWAKHFAFNRLLAVLTLLIGLLAVWGVAAGLSAARRVAMVGSALLAVAINVDLSANDQVLGARGGNITLMLMVLVGLLTLELTPRDEEREPIP